MDSTPRPGRDTARAAPKRAPVTAPDLRGFKYFRLLGPLVTHLHAVGTERDRAGNRQLFYDQYVTWLLLYFFSPIVTSLRGLQQVTTLAKVQGASEAEMIAHLDRLHFRSPPASKT